MKEIWKQSTLVGKFEVSSQGRVRDKKDERIRYQTKHKKGYLYIHYKVKGKKCCIKVHRLVATEFCDNPESKPQVNHINGMKDDNNDYNLEWNTHQENMRHAYTMGLIPPLKGSLNGRSLINEKLVHKICKDYSKGKMPKYIIDKYGITRNQAVKIKCKTTWKHITTQYKY